MIIMWMCVDKPKKEVHEKGRKLNLFLKDGYKFQIMRYIKIVNILTTAFLPIIFISSLISCQKVIELDLNSTAPQLVVEANISDETGPYFVQLSQSVDFYAVSIPTVSGAVVEISDLTTGIKERLTDLSNGLYLTSIIMGIPGHTYSLRISTSGQVYEAESAMPFPVGSLKLDVERELNDEPSSDETSGDQPFRYRVYYEITDPVQTDNYYRFVIFHKNRELRSRRVFSDQYHNGKIIADDFVLHDSIDFQAGDTVGIELQNIDKNTYNFFRTLREGASGLSFLSASPANPITNISNNGLGYFSAASLNKGYVVIPF
jgi:hypothetical protein